MTVRLLLIGKGGEMIGKIELEKGSKFQQQKKHTMTLNY